jgi:hypothetical protein
VAAVNSHDAERLRRLVHPATLACISDDTRDFFDEMFARDLGRPLTGPFRLDSMKALDGTAAPVVPARLGAYPIPPTHRIQITVTTGQASSVTVIRDLAPGKTGWLMVLVCPTTEGLAAFRAARRERQDQETRARVLVTELREPLRSEIEGLLKQGQRVEAMKRYSAATGQDLTMAGRVVDLLEGRR